MRSGLEERSTGTPVRRSRIRAPSLQEEVRLLGRSSSAFQEGGALYAEQVAAEHGFHNDPYHRLGYLVDQLWRAVRLVVDTGIHSQRWTREQAIDYMRAQTGKPESEVVAEIERYIVMPGQATSYMVGRLKIVPLCERARSRLGERFDLREFHDVVLRNGALPLVLLEWAVDDWLATRACLHEPGGAGPRRDSIRTRPCARELSSLCVLCATVL